MLSQPLPTESPSHIEINDAERVRIRNSLQMLLALNEYAGQREDELATIWVQWRHRHAENFKRFFEEYPSFVIGLYHRGYEKNPGAFEKWLKKVEDTTQAEVCRKQLEPELIELQRRLDDMPPSSEEKDQPSLAA